MTPPGPSNAREKAALVWADGGGEDGGGGGEDGAVGADAATAVVAHGLLGNLAVIRGATRMLLSGRDLDDAERRKLLLMLDTQSDLMQGVLADLVRGLPSAALTALDELSARERSFRGAGRSR